MFGFLKVFGGGAERIDPTDAVSMVRNSRAVLVDVREPHEFSNGHGKGAINIPMSAIAMRADPSRPDCASALETAKPVILYCASGARSGMAAGKFRRLGYETVYNLGSLREWNAGGGRMAR